MNKRFIDLKKTLGKFIANFSTIEEDGKTFIFDGDEVREGLDISTYDENGDVIPLADGEYTIKGVKVKVVDGKVTELPEKDSKPSEEQPSEQKQVSELEKQPNELQAKIDELTAENERLKAEIEELKKKPAAQPVPQRTEMNRHNQTISDDIKGTKYESAARIFGSK